MNNHFERILALVKKTGDTMIVVDKHEEKTYVVMGLDRYESMVLKQGEEVLNVNKSIIVDNEASTKSSVSPDEGSKKVWNVMQSAGENGETWNLENLTGAEKEDLERQYHEYASKHSNGAMHALEGSGEGDLDGLKNKDNKVVEEDDDSNKDTVINKDEYSEEQFYLEPVE
jgi:hypothetical protein